MLHSHDSFIPRGIYKIVEITNRNGSPVTDEVINRVGRHIVFPFDIEVGLRMRAFYVNYDIISIAGKMLLTTEVVSIQVMPDSGQLQVSTLNSQYLFSRME